MEKGVATYSNEGGSQTALMGSGTTGMHPRQPGSFEAPFPPGLYAVVDDTVKPELPILEKARRILEGGAKVLQLRLKHTLMRDAVGPAREIVALARSAGALCLVNDRVDLALLSGAQGVHLGDEDLPVTEARKLLGPSAVVGATVRNADQARRAHAEGASYCGIGPVFITATKTVGAEPLGLEGLASVVRDSPLPLVAIAGISLKNIDSIAATGVHSAAVISDVLTAEDLPSRVRALQAAFQKGRASRSL